MLVSGSLWDCVLFFKNIIVLLRYAEIIFFPKISRFSNQRKRNKSKYLVGRQWASLLPLHERNEIFLF